MDKKSGMERATGSPPAIPSGKWAINLLPGVKNSCGRASSARANRVYVLLPAFDIGLCVLPFL